MRYSATLALFLGALTLDQTQAVNLVLGKHANHTHSLTELPPDYAQVNSSAFTDAAVQARIDADEDIAREVRQHKMVDAASHNRHWKKHFKSSEFYKKYAQHTEAAEKCKHGCQEKQKELAQIKANYQSLSQKFEELKKKADARSLAQLNAKFPQDQSDSEDEQPPKDAKNLELWAEESSPFGLGGGAYGPAYPSPQPFVRGEKQWMDNAQNIGDWGAQQETVANTRIPYASTLIQTNDDVLHEDIEDDNVNLDILYEKESPMIKKNEVEKLSSTTAIPLDFHFVQTKDDDPSKMEGFTFTDVPLSTDLSLLKEKTPTK